MLRTDPIDDMKCDQCDEMIDLYRDDMDFEEIECPNCCSTVTIEWS